MEHGVTKTTVAGNAFQVTWTIAKLQQYALSPPILFDTFDKFKIVLRLKLKCINERMRYLVKMKTTYGVPPEKFTVSIKNGSTTLKDISYLPDVTWKNLGDALTYKNGSITKVKFELPNTDVSTLYSREINFSKLLARPGTDITIVAADGEEKKIHKAVLLARSDVLRAMWQSGMEESKTNRLNIRELDKDSLNEFITYLYCGTIDHFNTDRALIMLRIADKYNIKDLLTKCENMLRKDLSKDNAIDTFLTADLYNLQSLKALTVQLARELLVDIVLTKAWCETDYPPFFKLVYADLIKTDNKEVIIGDILQSVETAQNRLTIKFPIKVFLETNKIHLFTVAPEEGSGSFRLKVTETNMRSIQLSICQCQDDDNYHFTKVIINDIKTNMPQKAALPSQLSPLPAMALNEWYDIACFNTITAQFIITLDISYDIKYTCPDSYFSELLMDSSSADMTLESSDGIFRQVHKSVLIARNLESMVDQCDSKDNLKLCDLSACASDEFIKFVYLGNEEDLNVDFCAELLTHSHKYKYAALKCGCEKQLKTLINSADATDLLSLAIVNDAHFLEECVLDYVHSNKLEIIESECWRSCNNSDVIRNVIEHYIDVEELPSATIEALPTTQAPATLTQAVATRTETLVTQTQAPATQPPYPGNLTIDAFKRYQSQSKLTET